MSRIEGEIENYSGFLFYRTFFQYDIYEFSAKYYACQARKYR